MSRLLIHNAPPPLHPTDQTINAGMFQIGHVVAIIEDGENFGTDDIGPHSFVFEAKGTPKVDMEHLLADETIQVQKTYTDPDTKQDVTVFETVAVACRMWKAKDVPQMRLVSGLVNVAKGAELAFTTSYFDKTVDIAAVADVMRLEGKIVQ